MHGLKFSPCLCEGVSAKRVRGESNCEKKYTQVKDCGRMLGMYTELGLCNVLLWPPCAGV